MAIIIDADVVIRGEKRTFDFRKWVSSHPEENFALAAVTVAELWYGARQTEQKILDALFATIQCVPIDLEIGRQAGEYLRPFSKSHSVELGDAPIAAAAIHDLELWTRNRWHYPMKDISIYLA